MVNKYKFSVLVALIIMYLSLANSQTFDKVSFLEKIPDFDKLVHICMYFGLTSVLILENRKPLILSGRIFLIGLIPLSYGILMEILQACFTRTRTGDVFDALADGTGIVLSILLLVWIKPFKNLRSDNN